MKCPRIELLLGSVNGINVLFKTVSPYRSGTVQIFRNGLMGQRIQIDGWTELGNNKVRFNMPPKVGDILQAYYIPA